MNGQGVRKVRNGEDAKVAEEDNDEILRFFALLRMTSVGGAGGLGEENGRLLAANDTPPCPAMKLPVEDGAPRDLGQG